MIDINYKKNSEYCLSKLKENCPLRKYFITQRIRGCKINPLYQNSSCPAFEEYSERKLKEGKKSLVSIIENLKNSFIE